MNHKVFFGYSILLAIAIALGGCDSPATPAATPEPLACPTAEPQSCPTASTGLEPPVINEWRMGWTQGANYVITFNPGDKCTLENINPVEGNAISYEIVVNDQTYQNYMVIGLSLSEGKTFKDLQEYNSAGGDHNVDPPPWSKFETLEVISPMSRTWHGQTEITGPLYIICFVEGPDSQRIIETFDGIQIPNN